MLSQKPLHSHFQSLLFPFSTVYERQVSSYVTRYARALFLSALVFTTSYLRMYYSGRPPIYYH